jgi:hypothetical protein
MTPSKRPYIAPVVLRHGTLAQLTLGSGSANQNADKTSLPASDRGLKRDVTVVARAIARLRALSG